MAMDKEKQKIVVVAALGTVMLGVGVFQMLPKSKPEPSPSKKESSAKKKAVQDEEAAVEVAMSFGEADGSLPPRTDPFQPKQWMNPEPAIPDSAQAPQTSPTNAVTSRPRRGTRVYQDGNQPLAPALPQPLPGDIASSSPVADSAGAPGSNEADALLTGVILGQRPVAMITEPSGNRRLIGQGDSLENGGRVVAIRRDHVVVETPNRKRVTLTVGGQK